MIPIEQDAFVTWICERETEIVGHAGTRFGSPLVEWLFALTRSTCTIEDTLCGWMLPDARWIWRSLPAWCIRFQQKVDGYAFRPLTGAEAFHILASVELSMAQRGRIRETTHRFPKIHEHHQTARQNLQTVCTPHRTRAANASTGR